MPTVDPTAELWTRSGEALAAHLDAEELSLRQLAHDLNVSHETVRKWKSGSPIDSRHVLTVARVANYPFHLRAELVAHLLDVPVDELDELLGVKAVLEAARNVVFEGRCRELEANLEVLSEALDRLDP